MKSTPTVTPIAPSAHEVSGVNANKTGEAGGNFHTLVKEKGVAGNLILTTHPAEANKTREERGYYRTFVKEREDGGVLIAL